MEPRFVQKEFFFSHAKFLDYFCRPGPFQMAEAAAQEIWDLKLKYNINGVEMVCVTKVVPHTVFIAEE